ncbi:hypothetical protein L9F63_013758 [Diploptera punctata]|uniref:Uncharacterized protein n=1 Tax=Diploptera punctata TaxID=6984 RepID=A0AAD8EMG4_DIPPU|nr:hypothetical protein L9F63_013758 [Diploptera punctata]
MNQDSRRGIKLSREEEEVTGTDPINVLSKSLDSNTNFNQNIGLVASNTHTPEPDSLPNLFLREDLDLNFDGRKQLDFRLRADDRDGKQNSHEKSRNVMGKESEDAYLTKPNTVETVPRERKKWVRPPGVGQATNDSPVIIQDLSSLQNAKPIKQNTDEIHFESEDEVLPHMVTQSEVAVSSKNRPNEDIEISSDISNSYYFSPTTMGNTSKKTVDISSKVDNEKSTNIQEMYTKFISAKNSTSLSLDVQSSQNKDSNIVENDSNVSVRAPSPASVSSVTSSRRLEWDSGADVGYHAFHLQHGDNVAEKNLSTIERIALARGCSVTLRMDPEGIAGSVQNLPALPIINKPPKVISISRSNSIFRTPLAVSTPLEGEALKSSTGTDSESDIMPVVKMPRELYFFSSEQNFDNPSSQENLATIENNQNTNNENEIFLSRKISSSLTDLNESSHCEEHKSTNSLPRSQSHLNLLLEENKQEQMLNAVKNSFVLRYQQKKNNGLNTCSASSSSIATIVPKNESPRVLDKLTQTSISNVPNLQSVAVQVFESKNTSECEEKNTTSNSVEEQNSDSDIINDTVNNTKTNGYHSRKIYDLLDPSTKSCKDKLTVCKGAHKRTYVKKNKHMLAAGVEDNILDKSKEKLKNANSLPENKSGNHSRKSDSEWAIQNEKENVEKYLGTLDSIPSSTHTTGSWNGGDVSNGNFVSSRRDSSGVVGSANSFEYLPGHVYENNAAEIDQDLHKSTIPEDSSSHTESSHMSIERRLIKSGSFWNESSNSTLKNDLEKGINLIKALLDSKSYSSRSKKKLVRMLVNKLVAADYADDSEISLEKDISASLRCAKSDANSQAFINNSVERREENAIDNGDKEGIVEREDISGESAGEQQSKNKPQQTLSGIYSYADKCVGTVSSERSGLSSTSNKVYHSDVYSESRVETSTTGGQDGSSSNNTISSKKSCSWKDYTTHSEREYEHSSKSLENKSVLLKICESERENQLTWISTEIHHLNNLKQLLENQKNLSQNLSRREKLQRGNHELKKKSEVYLSSSRSESGCQNSISSRVETLATPVEHSVPDHFKGNSFKEPKKYHRRREFPSDAKVIQKSPSKKNTNVKKSISTQIPSSVSVTDGNQPSDSSKITRGHILTPDSESYSLTFE